MDNVQCEHFRLCLCGFRLWNSHRSYGARNLQTISKNASSRTELCSRCHLYNLIFCFTNIQWTPRLPCTCRLLSGHRRPLRYSPDRRFQIACVLFWNKGGLFPVHTDGRGSSPQSREASGGASGAAPGSNHGSGPPPRFCSPLGTGVLGRRQGSQALLVSTTCKRRSVRVDPKDRLCARRKEAPRLRSRSWVRAEFPPTSRPWVCDPWLPSLRPGGVSVRPLKAFGRFISEGLDFSMPRTRTNGSWPAFEADA